MATERETRGARGSTRPTRTGAPDRAARARKKRSLASKAEAASKPPKRLRPSERGEPSIRPVRWTGEVASQRPEAWHEDWDVSREELELEDAIVLEEPELADDELPTPDEDADEDGEAEPGAEPTASPTAGRARAEPRLDTPPLADDDEDDDERRGRRRSKTIARKQMMREQRRLAAAGVLPIVDDYDRPRAREECREAERPCLYVACRYHLFLDVNPTTGSIKLNFPDKEVWELEHTCALDIAERGGITLEEVGEIMNLTRERIRQVEASGLEKLREGHAALETFIDGRELGEGAPAPRAAKANAGASKGAASQAGASNVGAAKHGAAKAAPKASTARSSRPAPASSPSTKPAPKKTSSVAHRSVRPAAAARPAPAGAAPRAGGNPSSRPASTRPTSARPSKRPARDDD